LIEHSKDNIIQVALNRVRRCSTAITDKEVVIVNSATDEGLDPYEKEEEEIIGVCDDSNYKKQSGWKS